MARTKTVPKKNPETPEKQGTDSDNDSDSDNDKNVFNTVSSSVAKNQTMNKIYFLILIFQVKNSSKPIV